MSNYSESLEYLMDAILDAADTPNIANKRWTSEQLLDVVKRIRPGRIKNVEEKIGRKLPSDSRLIKPKWLLDRLYGIDCVIDANGNGMLIAIDWTSNPEEVANKVAKLESFKPMWRELGITRACVVLLDLKNFEGLGLVTKGRLAALDDKFVENVLFPICDEPVGTCTSYVIKAEMSDLES